MKIEEICQYLNELGILSIKNTPLFLSIYSGQLQNKPKSNKNYNIENNNLIIILFAFLKKVFSNDKELYELSSNIIHSHTKNKLIRQYQGICFLNKIIYHQIKNRFNHFLFILFTKKYPKRKYFPYNPLYAAKSASRLNEIKTNVSFSNTNQRRMNNYLNINDEYSLSYISNRNNKNHNRIIFNTGSDEGWKSENIPGTKRKNSFNQPIVHMPDLVEKMNMKKKEISKNNLKKKLYDAKIRINNYENIIPISRRNRQKEMKSREEENNYKKEKEDRIYKKLTEKEIDQKNILDRLYRTEIIKKQDMKRKEKENMKRVKSPIDWDKVNSINSKKKFLNLNVNSEQINSIKKIMNKPQKNINFSREVFSFGNTANNQNDNLNKNFFQNKNQIEYNNLNNTNEEKIMNYNEFKNNPINRNNLKQLNENEIEQNMNSDEQNYNEYELNKNEENNEYSLPKYPFNKNNPLDNGDNILNEENNNNEEEEIEIINQNENNNGNDNKSNLPEKFITNDNKNINKMNNEQIYENEEIMYNNKMKLPNEQNDYQYENNYEEGEGEEEEENNEEYDLENEEIEYDINNKMNNALNNDNNGNENENVNDKINNDNNNFKELLAENIEEYLDEEDKEI